MKSQHKSPKTAYESAEAEYLTQQKALKEMCEHRDRLAKQKAATLVSAKEAGEAWRRQFKESHGKVSDAVRKLKADEYGGLEEAKQLDELIEELATNIAAEQQATKKARERYEREFYREQEERVSARLKAAARAVLDTEAGQELAGALASKHANEVNAVLLSDPAFMAGLGFGAHEPEQPGFLATITRADQTAIEDEARNRVRKELLTLLMGEPAGKPVEESAVALAPKLKCEL